MIATTNLCERCGKQQLRGKSYNFWYGKKSSESRHYEGAIRVRSRYYSITGEQSAWICDRCVRPRQWLKAVFLALFPGLLAVSPFLPMWEDTMSKVCWGGIGLFFLGFLAWALITQPNDTGENMAIRIHKKKLKAEGYNAFMTTYYYNWLKKQSS